MNVQDADLRPWSRFKWAMAIGLVAGGQLGLIALLSDGRLPPPRSTPQTGLILPARLPAEVQALTDPALLALGSRRGFSAVWLAPASLPPLKNEIEAPQNWLDPEISALGQLFLAQIRTNTLPLQGMVFKTEPGPADNQEVAAPEPLRRQSAFRIEGDLASWRPAAPVTLPSWPAEDLLRPTRVRVVVDARGVVISLVVLEESGLAPADQEALNRARQMRFRPGSSVSRGQVVKGILVFDWNTEPAKAKPDEGAS